MLYFGGMTPKEALQKSIDEAGSQEALAKRIGCTQQGIGKMLNKAGRASPRYVLAIEAATGVSRHDLDPDIYPREEAA